MVTRSNVSTSEMNREGSPSLSARSLAGRRITLSYIRKRRFRYKPSAIACVEAVRADVGGGLEDDRAREQAGPERVLGLDPVPFDQVVDQVAERDRRHQPGQRPEHAQPDHRRQPRPQRTQQRQHTPPRNRLGRSRHPDSSTQGTRQPAAPPNAGCALPTARSEQADAARNRWRPRSPASSPS